MVLAGLLEPMGGSISLGGHDMHKLPRAVTGRHIGYIRAELVHTGRHGMGCADLWPETPASGARAVR